MATLTRDKRIETRVTTIQKDLIERAAALRGKTVADFVSTVLQAAAEKVIQDHEVMSLSGKDREAFIEALLNPPAPNAALKGAMKAHNELIRESR